MVVKSAVLLLLTLLLSPGPQGTAPPVTAILVRQAREGNRAGIAAVRTLSCRFTHEVVAEAAPGLAVRLRALPSGRYWRDGPVVRARVSFPAGGAHPPGSITDVRIQGERCLSLQTREGNGPLAGRHLSVGRQGWFDGDVWYSCLFTYGYGPPQALESLTLDQLLARPHKVFRAGWVDDDGRRLLHLEVAHPAARLGLWLDPGINYLARKATAAVWDKDLRREYRVLETARSADGAVLPVRVGERLYEGGQLRYEIRMSLSDVALNQPLAPDALRIPGLAGQTCTDQVRNSMYVVDADGLPAGPETPLQRVPGPGMAGVAVFPTVPPPPPAGATPRVDEPSLLRSRWVTVGAAVLVTAGAVYYARRRPRA